MNKLFEGTPLLHETRKVLTKLYLLNNVFLVKDSEIRKVDFNLSCADVSKILDESAA